MSVENGRKTFPFLRKGDGLVRYSSLKLPRYRNQNSTNGCQNPTRMIADDNEAEINFLSNGDENIPREDVVSPAVGDSGKGSSPREEIFHSDQERRCDVVSTPKEDADALDPSLLDRRRAWETKEQVNLFYFSFIIVCPFLINNYRVSIK